MQMLEVLSPANVQLVRKLYTLYSIHNQKFIIYIYTN